MLCRVGCAACCTVISISSPLPGMPNGKPAGVRCVNLNDDNGCMIHLSEDYPSICKSFKANIELCGDTNEDAKKNIAELEQLTR